MRFLTLAALLIGCAGSVWWWGKVNDRFHLDRIEWELVQESSPDPSDEVRRVLSQEFRYLDRGRQTFVFESADGQYVLKLPHRVEYEMPFRSKFLPREMSSRVEERQIKRKAFLYESFRLSHQASEYTGVTYVHLGKTETSIGRVQLRDPLGRQIQIDLDAIPFLIQKRCHLLFSHLLELDRDEQEKRLMAFLDLLLQVAEKGICCKDSHLMKNIGYDGKLAIQIDVGSYCQRSDWDIKDYTRQALWGRTDELFAWLKEQDPELFHWFYSQVVSKSLALL